jgi:hypothetical protein
VSAAHKTIDEKLGDFIRRLASPYDGEIVAAVRALKRKSHGEDIHSLAARIEKPALSNVEMQKIFDAGIEAGLRKTEEERGSPNYFRDVGEQTPKRRFLYEREPGSLEAMVD